MKSKSTLVIVMLMFALALGAGVVAGKLTARLPSQTPQASPLSLTDALKLSSDQQEKMKAIWEGVRDNANDCVKKANEAQKEQNEKLLAMLSDEQKAKYQELSNETAAKIGALDQRRKESFAKAVDDTNAILNPRQQELYKEIIKGRVGQMSSGEWDSR